MAFYSLTEDEIAEMRRVVEYLNDTWRGDLSFELVQAISGTWYIFPEFPENSKV